MRPRDSRAIRAARAPNDSTRKNCSCCCRGTFMAVKPNRPGIANARSLIRSGKSSHGGWDEAAIDRSPKNAGAFLAIDTDFKPEVQDHWKFPVAQGGAVNRKALGTAIGYAKKSGYSAVASEAQKLADEADKKAGAAANGAGKRFVGL